MPIVATDEAPHRSAILSAHEDFQGSVGKRQRLDNRRHDADLVQITGTRIDVVGAPLRDREDPPIGRYGMTDGPRFDFPRPMKSGAVMREQHKVSQRKSTAQPRLKGWVPGWVDRSCPTGGGKRPVFDTDPRSQDVPVAKAEHPGEQFQALATGQNDGFGLQDLTQGRRHGLGVTEVANAGSFAGRTRKGQGLHC
jgi:hypothetical protein